MSLTGWQHAVQQVRKGRVDYNVFGSLWLLICRKSRLKITAFRCSSLQKALLQTKARAKPRATTYSTADLC